MLPYDFSILLGLAGLVVGGAGLYFTLVGNATVAEIHRLVRRTSEPLAPATPKDRD